MSSSIAERSVMRINSAPWLQKDSFSSQSWRYTSSLPWEASEVATMQICCDSQGTLGHFRLL
eukprot:1024355-Prorocentrum_lima.AAC.1